MKRWLCAPLLLLSFVAAARALESILDQDTQQKCEGMYSKKSWGGPIDKPFILVKFKTMDKDKKGDPKASILVWEWKDSDYIGKPEEAPFIERKFICNDETIPMGYCEEKDRDKYILGKDAENSKLEMKTEVHSLKSPGVTTYYVEKTGYYCVATASDDGVEYQALIEFRNAYGELPAAQIPKLPFYGGITIVYAVVCIFWGFLYYQNRHDILPVQNYITAILIFLVIEMFMTWFFYEYENKNGGNVGSKILMVVVAILNAARNSFSFFLLLIVCMGYGVVKPSLGKTMIIVRWLALTHFVFGVIYAIASLTIRPDDAGPLVLLVILPLSATLTAFYIWTLNSLSATMKDLMERKQHVKALMYKRLWWCILGSIIIIFAFFFLNSFNFAGASRPDFAPTHWQSRWFILDGWLNIVYFVDVCFVAYLWRPTVNNRRFAMSDEIAQDDEGFEIASMRDSLSDLEDQGPPAYDPAPRGGHNLAAGATGAVGASASTSANRDASPLPAPKPTKPMPPPRASLEGDTIFAVGEEDKWSEEGSDDDDDEDDSDEEESESNDENERKTLTGKKA